MLNRRLLAIAVSAVLATFALSPVTSPSAGSTAAGSGAARSAGPTSLAPEPATVVTDWERTLFRTVYTENASPIPTGVPYLGFTSVAMYDAVKRAFRHRGSPTAAVATAAHHVLVEYFPASEANLDADLAASLADVPDGLYETRGRIAGARAAHDMIESRENDGRDDTSIVYDKAPGPGVWQPAPGGTMLGAWLGFVDKLVLERPIRVNGPDPISSWEYAQDYLEVKRLGSSTSTHRTPFQTETAQFFNSNAATMVAEGLLRHLDENPMGLWATARLFATMYGGMTDAVITCWRLKFDGFWRPNQAISGTPDDGNPATVPEPGWASLLTTPPYADYVSGHGCLTGTAIEAIRNVPALGEETELTLVSANPLSTDPERTYTTLSEIEFDAFNSRIWGGLHFRDAMEDAYVIGHTAARRASHALH